MPVFNTVSLILDIIALVLAIIIIVKCGVKGFLSSIISFLGGLFSVIIAAFLSKPASQYIYTNFLEKHLIEKITASLGDMATTNASAFLEGLETSLQSLPAPLLSLMQLNSQSVVSVLSENIGESVDTLSLQLSENVLKPLTTTLVSAVLFIILFIVLLLIFKLLAKAFSKIKKVPVLGPVNTVLGVVFGVLNALVVLYVICVVLNLLIMFLGNSVPYISTETLQNSYIFGWLSSIKLSL